MCYVVSILKIGNILVVKAVAYLRTSSATNVGSDRDSVIRQGEAIAAYGERTGIEILASFHDPGVSGTDPLETRPGFSALLDLIEGNGVRTVVLEDASRLARELLTQELGIIMLQQRGVRVLTTTGDDLTDTSDPMKTAMRQIAGAFAQLEKARLVAKLKHARDRKRREKGHCEGARPNEKHNRAACERAREIRAVDASRSLRIIAETMAADGLLSSTGKPFTAKIIAAMLRRLPA
jgi:DNA invertase Pin-like site-specific DNA recombinase